VVVVVVVVTFLEENLRLTNQYTINRIITRYICLLGHA
jgi:hypothetical protein